MAWKLVMALGALALALPSAAQAATHCVNAPGCAGTVHPTLEAALAAAQAGDEVRVGPGTYTGPYTSAAAVALTGAGREKTVLTAGDDATVLTLAAGSAVRDLSLQAGGAGAKALLLPGGGTVEDAEIRAATGIDATGVMAGATTVRRTRIAAALGVHTAALLTAEDVVIALAGAPPATGIQVTAIMGMASASLRHVTIAGAGTGTGLDVRGASMSPVPSSASATLADSVITGLTTHIAATSFDCGGLPMCFSSPARVDTAYSAYDPAKVVAPSPSVVGEQVGTPAPIAADPRLHDDLRPRFDSPLVDAADPAAVPGTADASGLPRVVGPRADIGALEYQRRAPRVDSAVAAPGEAAVGEPIRFSVAGTDPEGETFTAAWKFSDGTTATGLEVTRAFGAPGPVVADVQLTDQAGAGAGASVTVAIKAPPSGEPPPSGDKSKIPRVVARVVPDGIRLRAAKRRDRKAPYRFKLRGKVVLPQGVAAAGCQDGLVKLAIRAGKRRLSRSVRARGDCSFRLTFKLGRKKARRVTVRPSFAGTAALAPRDGRALRLRAG
jgi:hypothetical protein